LANYKPLGVPFDRTFRNNLNENFITLDGEVGKQKQRVDNLITEVEQPSEVVDARGEAPVLRDRLDGVDLELAEKAKQSDLLITDNTANDALGKANNPLAALSNAGYKIPLSDLSDEVKNYMTGTTGITTSKGYFENNRGVEFPLKNIVRDGQLWSVTQEVKDVVLDAKVVNPRDGKYYVLAYVSNGYNGSYGITIYEYDKATFNSNSASSEKRIVWYSDTPLSQVSGVTTRTVTKEDITFVVTIDYSKITSASGLGLNIADSTSGRGRGMIIDESLYTKIPSNKISSNFPIVAKKQGSVYSVKFNYSPTQNMIIEFDKLGVNQILHFKRFYLQTKTSDLLNDDFTLNKTLIYDASSDWLSPYRIEALNNGNGNARFTTGGNHGTDGGAGFPTARLVKSEMYADENLISDGQVVFCNEIRIEATHHVSAYNAVNLTDGTKRDSLKEVVSYNVKPENIGVSVYIEALEGLLLTDYSGLQSQEGAWGSQLYYMHDSTPVKFDISGDLTGQSGLKSESSADRWVMKKDGNIAVAYYNLGIGIGDRSLVSDSNSLFWHTATKIYGRLIYNGTTGITLNSGDGLFWSGGFTFTKGLTCVGSESAYVIYRGGKKIYVVDFFGNTNTVLKTHKQDINKEITVIDKSSTVSCDTFISPNGLEISSTGYGQLKFSVN
jgi:hypothetical protein